MASSVAASMPHSIPHAPLPPMPRVRPPRFLKGQPRDIDIPQPEGPVATQRRVDPATGKVTEEARIWVQGKWRSRASNAALDRQKLLSQQVKKAVARKTHGCNIYAYYHLRTKQVVYSTSRIMQPTQIMPQLVFHGKKTVPSGLRRDVWRPYFSIHFPETDNGKRVGLTAYQRLREFAMRRQLDPDQDSLLVTQEDVDKAMRRGGTLDPVQVRQLFESDSHREDLRLDLPTIGDKLNKRARAKKLMDQKATSVADTAFVLGLSMEQLQQVDFNAEQHLAQKTSEQLEVAGHRATRTIKYKRAKEAEKETELSRRAGLVSTVSQNAGQMALDHKIAKQIALEHDGAVESKDNHVIDMQEIPNRPMSETRGTTADVRILWADVRDGTYARAWPEGVFHGELQPLALEKTAVLRTISEGFEDVDGTVVSEQRQRGVAITGSSVHVHGRELIPKGQAKAAPSQTSIEDDKFQHRRKLADETRQFRELVSQIEAIHVAAKQSITAPPSQQDDTSPSSSPSTAVEATQPTTATPELNETQQAALRRLQEANPSRYQAATDYIAERNSITEAIEAGKLRLGSLEISSSEEAEKEEATKTLRAEIEDQEANLKALERGAVEAVLLYSAGGVGGGQAREVTKPAEQGARSGGGYAGGVVVPENKGLWGTVRGWFGGRS